MIKNISRNSHSIHELYVHLVFISKYRKKIFTSTLLKTIESIFRSVCTQFKCDILEFNGENDHIHFILKYPPSIDLSTMVNRLKGTSSRKIKKRFNWSPGYCAVSCGGAPLDIIKEYIKNQSRPK